MKIGIVSDTHGHVGRTTAAIVLLQAAKIEGVLHCGDIGGPEIVRLLDHWPGHFVAGNIDEGNEPALIAALSPRQTWHGLSADITLAGRRIAIAHGHVRGALDELIAANRYDLVCTGHTHQAVCEQRDSTTLLNPGALYRSAKPSFAIVDLQMMDVEMHWL